jgi:phage-related baseplate assembly protein
MSTATLIDFSKLPPPDIIGALDYETILADMLTSLVALDPSYTALTESDPAHKILEVAAYRELLLRARVNDAARAVMLPTAIGADLDNLAALFAVARNTITPANPDAIPPTEAIMETDADFRARVVLALNQLSTAGPAGAYRFHALRVAAVRDAAVEGPPTMPPGHVRVSILGRAGAGTPGADTLAAVEKILTDEDVRPLTDTVTVVAAEIVTYDIRAAIYTYDGPDPAVVIADARAGAEAYAAAMHRLGNDITISGLHRALHVAGVQRVELTDPAASIIIQPNQAPFCQAIELTHAGTDQ